MESVLLGLGGEAIVDCAVEQGGDQLIGVYWGVFNFLVKVLNGLAMVILYFWIGKQNDMGDLAIRCMSFSAGGLLFVGVTFYMIVRKRGDKS